jgi:hypothetical protein
MGFGRKRVTGCRGRGFGLFEGWRVIESEGWRDVWEVSSSVRGKVYKTVPFIYDILLIFTGRSHGAKFPIM